MAEPPPPGPLTCPAPARQRALLTAPGERRGEDRPQRNLLMRKGLQASRPVMRHYVKFRHCANSFVFNALGGLDFRFWTPEAKVGPASRGQTPTPKGRGRKRGGRLRTRANTKREKSRYTPS